MNKKFPHIRIETIDPDAQPTPSNWRIYMNGEDISGFVSGVRFSVGVGEVTRITIDFLANVETNDIPLVGDES